MFRNQYDTDVVTYSPTGRLFQVEYAMEAVKQGSCVVGICGEKHVVLATLKRAASELSAFQKKAFKIDSHLGIAVSGLTADGRVLSRYMRNECINHQFVYDSPMNVRRLVQQVADKSQVATQRSWARPYGVGLLVAGYDSTGPHLMQTCPSGNYYEYKAMAIGARSQASKTYLEKKVEEFPGCDLQALCKHALLSLKEACADGDLSVKNAGLCFVGEGSEFTVLENEAVAPYLALLEEDGPAAAPAEAVMDDAPAAAAPDEPQPMEQ
eukprot:CAMPEP_0170144038 /NCGR_PEP_ID=MMETSP0033_2-20121228/13268_1 /TAXON_ID=195969 /ORGANISM="Dolichomastix tenuilepis, Strain CCMP3274" /LENGTH=266 /DNA_ID=CAMNT_0010380515 /DNA_START=148 /DNA_END=948 /DNA_ORIENTATION=+